MGTRRVEQGETARRVARRVREERAKRGLSLQQVSDKLTNYGRPMLASGVSKIETGDRRVDVDDLVALAEVLDVLPSQLLADPEPVSGFSGSGSLAVTGSINAEVPRATWSQSGTVDNSLSGKAESTSKTEADIRLTEEVTAEDMIKVERIWANFPTEWAVSRRIDEAMSALWDAKALLPRLLHANAGDTVVVGGKAQTIEETGEYIVRGDTIWHIGLAGDSPAWRDAHPEHEGPVDGER